jgi:hypothetical protein
MQSTPSLLEVLRAKEIQTSFALIGRLVQMHQEIAKQILKDGHEIVNHSYSHPRKFSLVSPHEMGKEVESFQNLMLSSYNYRPRGFRAPHLMRKYNKPLFRILRENGLYDASYVGRGLSMVDGVVEIPLTACPDHRQLCFDYWHSFQFPFLSCGLAQFFRLWEHLVRNGDFISVFFDPHLVSDELLQGMLQRVPGNYEFCRLEDVARRIEGSTSKCA